MQTNTTRLKRSSSEQVQTAKFISQAIENIGGLVRDINKINNSHDLNNDTLSGIEGKLEDITDQQMQANTNINKTFGSISKLSSELKRTLQNFN